MLENLRQTFNKRGACVARAENVSMATANVRDYDNMVDRLLKTKGATAVVVLLEPKQSRLLLEAANRKKTGSKQTFTNKIILLVSNYAEKNVTLNANMTLHCCCIESRGIFSCFFHQ